MKAHKITARERGMSLRIFMKSRKSEPTIDGRAITGARELRDPRSREYAIQTMFSLKGFLDDKTFSAKHAETELEEIKTYKHWEVLGFENLDSYLEHELGVNQRQLRARLAKDLAADPDVPPLREKQGRPEKSEEKDSNGIITRGGNNAPYLVRSLKRDHPKIAEALARGEYPSARAAAIAAGIVKKLSVLDRIRKLLPELTTKERMILAEELQNPHHFPAEEDELPKKPSQDFG
jgi:hypothetical protein